MHDVPRQERIVNVPSRNRYPRRPPQLGDPGGMKPTHMIGGLPSDPVRFHGTVGCNRDEMVVVRKWARSTGWMVPRR